MGNNIMRNFPLKFVRVVRRDSNETTITEITDIQEGDIGFLNRKRFVFATNAAICCANDIVAETHVPDPGIKISDMEGHGFQGDDMFPLRRDAAERLFLEDLPVSRIEEDGSKVPVANLAELLEHAEMGGLFGIEKADWEAYGEYQAMKQDLRKSAASKAAHLLYGSCRIFTDDGTIINLAALDQDEFLPATTQGYKLTKRIWGEETVDTESFNGLSRFTMEFIAPELSRTQVSHETKVQLLRCGAVLRENNGNTGCKVLTQVLVPWDIAPEEIWYVTSAARALYGNILGVEHFIAGTQTLGSPDVEPMDYLMDAYDQALMSSVLIQDRLTAIFYELKNRISLIVEDTVAKVFPNK